jgi:hypothetical protein
MDQSSTSIKLRRLIFILPSAAEATILASSQTLTSKPILKVQYGVGISFGLSTMPTYHPAAPRLAFQAVHLHGLLGIFWGKLEAEFSRLYACSAIA